MIERIIIKNLKGIKYANISFTEKNVIVGDNGVGKSTILEALSLALGAWSQTFELTPYLFHKSTWDNLDKRNLPTILVEVYFTSIEGYELYTGTNNSLHQECLGIKFEAKFDEDGIEHIEDEDLTQIPCEYYSVSRKWFSEDIVKPYHVPFTLQFINSSSALHNVKMTQFITRHLQANLSNEKNRHLKTTLRGLRTNFNDNDKIKQINQELTEVAKGFHSSLEISLDLTTYAAWNAISCPFVDDIPVTISGQGNQCILKTLVSLNRKETARDKYNIYLIEEPESHLSHTYMYHFLNLLERKIDGQIFVTTHNSYIANRLNLKNLILISKENEHIRAFSMDNSKYDELFQYFYKTTDYPTLRLALCKKAILVEGPTDEMIVQYHVRKLGKDLFADRIELLGVGGVRFKNFISLARTLGKNIAIITDNDGKSKNEVERLYCYDEDGIYMNNVKVFTPDNPQIHTLEIAFATSNEDKISRLSKIIRKNKVVDDNLESITQFMLCNKTMWGFRLLENDVNSFTTPEYIEKAIDWMYE